MKTKITYCTKCREDKDHGVIVDQNGEFVFTCTTCDSFFKLPAGLTVDEIRAEITERKERHANLVTVEDQEALLAGQNVILEQL